MGIWHWIPVLSSWLSLPSGARSSGHLLRRAGHQSVWASGPGGWWSCWGWCDQLGGLPLALPTFATSGFWEFFKLGERCESLSHLVMGGGC